jgi:hypothetical protein
MRARSTRRFGRNANAVIRFLPEDESRNPTLGLHSENTWKSICSKIYDAMK